MATTRTRTMALDQDLGGDSFHELLKPEDNTFIELLCIIQPYYVMLLLYLISNLKNVYVREILL